MTEDELIEAVRGRLPANAPPPASGDEVAEAERRLGFRLTPLLRRLYVEVANGSWGPEYGASGLITGARVAGSTDEGAVAWYEAMLSPEVGPIEDGAPPNWPGWPHGLLAVSHWGCAIWSCVDCTSPDGRVSRFDPGACGEVDDVEPWQAAWRPESDSQRDWLEAWLADRLSFTLPTP